MEKAIHSLVDTPKLRNLLAWVEQVTDNSAGDFQPIGKRAIALVLAYAKDLAQEIAEDLANDHHAQGFTYAYAISFARDLAQEISNALVEAYAFVNFDAQKLPNALFNAYAYAYAYAYANANDFAYAYAYAIEEFIKYTQCSEKFQVYRNVNYSQLINNLENLKQQKPDDNKSRTVRQAFVQKILQTWLEAFHLTPEMLDLSEIETLDSYLDANLLMVECKKAAVRVSQETWSGIESRMLFPVSNNQ